MHTQDQISRGLAVCLAGVAGFLDAIGFLVLGGFFVSFMSGNSTRFGVASTSGATALPAMLAVSLIALFVLGVMLGQVVRHLNHRLPATAVLALVFLLLLAAALTAELHRPFAAVLITAIAMGASNNAFARRNEVSIGVTYMTGTLVRFGQGLAAWLLGDRGRVWFPYLLLWAGLAAGATLGAAAYRHWGLHALWIAVGFYPLPMLVMLRLERRAAG